jgi:manganese/zinc/iron transport system permease protein
MEEKEWVTIDGQEWAMTEKGFEEAANLYNKQSENNE